MSETVLEIKKGRGCVLLCLSDGETLRVPASLYRERKVREGETIEPMLYKAFILQRGPSHAMDAAVRLLSVADRTEKELRERLEGVGYPEVVVEGVLQKLVDLNLVNDARYAEVWTRSRAHRQGRQRLRQELTRRGVSREDTEEALSVITDEEQL